jgi:nitroreductase
MLLGINVQDHRAPDHAVESLFVERWSPRLMSGEAVEAATLNRVLEAARWAPSAFNAQPWHFVYAHRATPSWSVLFDLLVEANQGWCADAGVLMVLFSRHLTERNGKPAPTHAFDAGAAWQNLALQGAQLGMVVHGMAGFDHDAAPSAVGAPEAFTPQAMIALGWPGDLASVDDERRARELPSDRKPVESIASEGRF